MAGRIMLAVGNVKCSQHMQINRHSSSLYLCNCLANEGQGRRGEQSGLKFKEITHVHTHIHSGSKCALSVAKRRSEYVSLGRLK